MAATRAFLYFCHNVHRTSLSRASLIFFVLNRQINLCLPACFKQLFNSKTVTSKTQNCHMRHILEPAHCQCITSDCRAYTCTRISPRSSPNAHFLVFCRLEPAVPLSFSGRVSELLTALLGMHVLSSNSSAYHRYLVFPHEERTLAACQCQPR
jgi:hypothetical protein